MAERPEAQTLFYRKTISTLLLATAIIVGCGDDKITEPEPGPDFIISNDTYIVEEGGPVRLNSIDNTTFTFTYEGAPPNIEAGYIIVGREQGGYFRKALSVTLQDNHLIIETGDAAIVEAIQKGHFHITDTLDWSSPNRSGRRYGQRTAKYADGVEILENGTIEFSDLQIFSDDYLNITITEGSISFIPVIDIDGDIDFPSILREFHALATGTIDVYADFQATSSRDYAITNEITIPGCEWEFGPYWISIGGWPVMYSFALSLMAGFEYSSDAPLETEDGFRNYASLTVGARYEDGDWESVFEPTFDLSARQVIWDKSGDIALKAYIKPTITMKIYTYPGPYFDAGPYLAFNGDVDFPQWQYELNAGLESSLGIEVRFFSFELVDFSTVLFANEITIASESGDVTNQAPSALITAPLDNAYYLFGETIIFNGLAEDPQDGPLFGNSLVWTSNIDGLIGTGMSFTRNDLSIYSHQIVLTATDSQGNSGADTITLNITSNEFIVDPRDGQIYPIVQIGNQRWLAKNLNYNMYSAYYYDNDPQNGDIYGRLYSYFSACSSCPEGWHLPNIGEWTALINHLGGQSVAGGKMKTTGTIEDGNGLWHAPNTGATNESGFSALPGGVYYSFHDDFWSLGYSAYFWSADTNQYGMTNIIRLRHDSGDVEISSANSDPYDSRFSSVRCIRDRNFPNEPPYLPSDPSPPDGSDEQPINTILQWNCTDPDGDPLTYDVYFGTTDPPPLVSSNQPETTFDPGELEYDTTYYWQIIADDGEYTTESDIWSFTTERRNLAGQIAFCSERDGNFEVYLMDTDGSNQVRLTYNNAVEYNPSWSPDRSKIAFASLRDGNAEIYIMNPDGSNQINLTNYHSNDRSPDWSPDGQKIAFSSDMNGDFRNIEICVIDIDGTNKINLTNNPAHDHGPAWSPDGSLIAFDRYSSLMVMDSNNGENQRTLIGGGLNRPEWSPDGSYIVCQSGMPGAEIYMIDSDGSNQRNLSNNLENDINPSWR